MMSSGRLSSPAHRLVLVSAVEDWESVSLGKNLIDESRMMT